MAHLAGKRGRSWETYATRGAQGGEGPPGPPGPPGPSGIDDPLVTAFWVDRETAIPAPDRDGSIARPFADIDEAEAAAHVPDYSALILTPNGDGGVYTQPALGAKSFAYNGLGSLYDFSLSPPGSPGVSSLAIVCDVGGDAVQVVRNCGVSLEGTGSRSFEFRDCRVTGVSFLNGFVKCIDCISSDAEAQTLEFFGASVLHINPTMVAAESIHVRDAVQLIGGSWTAPEVVWSNCQNITDGPVILADDVTLDECAGDIGDLTIGASLTMSQVRWNTTAPRTISMADGATLVTDRVSIQDFYASGGAIVWAGAVAIRYLDGSVTYSDESVAEFSVTNTVAFERILVENAGAELGFDLTNWVNGSRLRARLTMAMRSTANAPDVRVKIVLERTSGNLDSQAQSVATFITNAPVGLCIEHDFGPLDAEATFRLRAEWVQDGAGTRTVDPAHATLPTFATLSAEMLPATIP